jgi:RND family efflux transporter MFP subunit
MTSEHVPVQPSHQDRRAPGARRLLPFAAVAVLFLALGVGASWLFLRSRTPVATPSAAPEAVPAGEHAGMPGMGAAEGDHPAGAGGNVVYISPSRQQTFGVRTTVVGQQPIDSTIRTVGTLAYDETRVAEVHTKIAGWVERVWVDYVGKDVRRNQPLFSVYSPELVSTQTEYLLARKGLAELGQSRVATARTATESLLAAARARLKLWDIPEEHIRELETTGKVQRTLMLHSPFNGIVLERNAVPGQYVTPEMTAFKIADLSRIWAFGALFEYELPLVKVGQEAEIEFPYGQASRRLKGRITFIYPEVDPQTRRVRVRVEFANPGLQFKPESYVTMVIRTEGGKRLAVPKEAVIDTGAKRYAILAHPNGYFEPRDIEVGEPGDQFYPLLSGLKEGDRIVTSAQFLVDSETNLQSALQAMAGHGGMDMSGGAKKGGLKPASPATPSAHDGHER